MRPAPRSTRRQEASEPPASSTPAHATLTLSQVTSAWESVKKRTKQRSGLLAAYLQHCQVVGVEESPDGAVILIQAANQRHFEQVKSNDRPKDIEWALSTEFAQPCKVRLIPPGQGSNAASYTLGAVVNQPSAYRERAQPEPPAPPAGAARAPEPPASSAPTRLTGAGPLDTYEAPPLARPQGVRENKRVVLSKEELERKVQQDPVVQEVVRTFQAKIKDIQAK